MSAPTRRRALRGATRTPRGEEHEAAGRPSWDDEEAEEAEDDEDDEEGAETEQRNLFVVLAMGTGAHVRLGRSRSESRKSRTRDRAFCKSS